MKHIAIKHRILFLTFFIFSACAVNALTLNPLIEAPDGHTLINQEPLLFNEQIIFVTEKDDDYTLWSYDLTDHSYTTLHIFEDYFYPKFFVVDNYFHFKDGFDPNQLWQSDGTLAGTKPVGAISLHGTPLSQKGGLIFAQGGFDGTVLIAYDGQIPVSYITRLSPLGTDVPMPNLACGFNNLDVIIPSRQNYSNQTKLMRHNSDGKVDYSDDLPQSFMIEEQRVWYYEGTCFYHIDGQFFSDILVIPELGDHYFLGEQFGYTEVNYLTRFKDHYYMMANDENHKNHIVKLSSDLSTVVKQVEFDSFGGVSLTVSDQFLIAYTRTGGGVSPPAWNSGYYDENLNEISGLGGPFTDVPKIYPRDSGETVVFNEYSNGLNLKTLTTDITKESPGLDLNQSALINVITHKDETETYALVKDLHSGQSSIKTLEAVPDMGALSVGNWFDPDYQSQGMSIVEGLRDDGSRYLFVTLYLFRDGQPLWLAGVGEISYPQPTIDIELGEYSGLGLWQADTAANVEKFADMTLSMSGCHQMMMHLETKDDQIFNIELQRMANSDINLRCKD